MPSKAMILASDSPEYRPPLTLSPLAIEDLTGEPVYTLAPAGRAEVAAEACETIPLTPLLVKRLEEFRAARRQREAAPKGELGKAIAAEDVAALNVAWALECAIEQDA